MTKEFDEKLPIEIYDSSALGEWSFENGDKVLTIKFVTEEPFFDKSENKKIKKRCVYFEEEALPLVLNKTNRKMLAQVCGSHIPYNWRGKKVILGRRQVSGFGGVLTWAIRVQPEIPKEHASEPITPEQIAQIRGLIETGAITNENAMLKYFRIKALEEMSKQEAEALIKQKSAGI